MPRGTGAITRSYQLHRMRRRYCEPDFRRNLSIMSCRTRSEFEPYGMCQLPKGVALDGRRRERLSTVSRWEGIVADENHMRFVRVGILQSN